jgi:hypothetical protein
MFSSDVKASAALWQLSRSGRNDLGGEQTCGPEHNEMAAVSKRRSVMKSF